MKKVEKEKQNIRNYFMTLAREYEKNDFLVAAAYLYRRYDREKARRLYMKIAKRAEKHGLLITAAEAYEAAGRKDKVKEMMKAKIPIKKRDTSLSRQFFEPPRKRPSKEIAMFLFATTKFEREGRFDKAREYWLRSAQYYERLGEFKFAALYYFRAGDLRSAKRLWNRTARFYN